MIVAEPAHLLVSDLGQPLGGESQRRTPQPRDRFDVVAAALLEDAAAVPACNDQRTFLLMLPQIRLHVHEACNIASFERLSHRKNRW